MRSLFLVFCTGCAFARASAAQSTANDSLRRAGERVVGLEVRRQLVGATPAVIDSLLALYREDVVYEHPNAGAVVRGKVAMRRGMMEYLGSVRNVSGDAPRVTVGNGVVVWESTTRMELLDGSRWTPVTRHGLRIIEFDSSRLVRRIIDYPW